MRLKNRLQYVQEFRKITALQKLPTLKEGFGDLFLQNKQENAKFLRTRDEPNIPQIQLNLYNYKFLENQCIDQYRKDFHKNYQEQLRKKQQSITQQTKDYNEWSHNLVTYPKQGTYEYKFFYGKASPPVAVSKLSTGVQAGKFQISSQKDQGIKKEIQQIKALNYKRYDFHEINKHFAFTSNKKDQDEQNDKRADLMKFQAQKFRIYKSLTQIDKINELDMIYDHFGYEIDPNEMINQSKSEFYNRYNMPKENPIAKQMKQSFKYLSTYKSNEDFNIEFFRDIGMPSRQLNAYVRNSFKDRNSNNHRKDLEENVMMQDKIDTKFLYFLTPSQLKIQPKKLCFYDAANISMGRVTNLNSHMCIRNQKVTRGQYQKLLKKVQRLYKMQTQGNNATTDKAIVTDNIQETLQNKDIFQKADQQMPIKKIVDQILLIRQEMHTFEPRENHKIIDQKTVGIEIHNKMYKLLQKLYNIITKGMQIKYPINQIYQHMDKINGNTQQQYDKKRLLWFIMTVLEQIQKGKNNERDLKNLLTNQKKTQPIVIKYKGKKIVQVDTMGAKGLYFMGKAQRGYQTPLNKNDRSTTPLKGTHQNLTSTTYKTPIKNIQRDNNRSPINKDKTSSNLKVTPNSSNIKSKSPINGRTAVKSSNNNNLPDFGTQRSSTPIKNNPPLRQQSRTPLKQRQKTPQKQTGLTANPNKKLPTSNSTTQKKRL